MGRSLHLHFHTISIQTSDTTLASNIYWTPKLYQTMSSSSHQSAAPQHATMATLSKLAPGDPSFTCIATTLTGGRCLSQVSHLSQSIVVTLLKTVWLWDPRPPDTQTALRSIAEQCLCHMHQDHHSDIARRWKDELMWQHVRFFLVTWVPYHVAIEVRSVLETDLPHAALSSPSQLVEWYRGARPEHMQATIEKVRSIERCVALLASQPTTVAAAMAHELAGEQTWARVPARGGSQRFLLRTSGGNVILGPTDALLDNDRREETQNSNSDSSGMTVDENDSRHRATGQTTSATSPSGSASSNGSAECNFDALLDNRLFTSLDHYWQERTRIMDLQSDLLETSSDFREYVVELGQAEEDRQQGHMPANARDPVASQEPQQSGTNLDDSPSERRQEVMRAGSLPNDIERLMDSIERLEVIAGEVLGAGRATRSALSGISAQGPTNQPTDNSSSERHQGVEPAGFLANDIEGLMNSTRTLEVVIEAVSQAGRATRSAFSRESAQGPSTQPPSNPHAQPSPEVIARANPVTCTHRAVRRNLEGNCSICLEPLMLGEELVWCKEGCGQNLHGECWREYADTQTIPKCVVCRSRWDTRTCSCDDGLPE